LWCNVGFAACIKGDCNNGYGTYAFASGNKYVGEFKDGKLHGQGTKTFADGRVNNGIWKNGELVKHNNIKTQIAKKEPAQTQKTKVKKINKVDHFEIFHGMAETFFC